MIMSSPATTDSNTPVSSFPIISLSSPTVVNEFESACTKFGGFVLTDHGIPTELLDDVLSNGHSFFDLPDETKEKYNLQKYGAKWRGYMPVGGERSVHGTLVDFKEGLYLGDEHSPDDPMVKAGLPTFGSNVFANAELPGMRPLFQDYHERMKTLGNQMMDILSESLGLETNYLQDHVTQHDPVILPRMFRYLPQPPPLRNGDEVVYKDIQWGIGRHSDYGQ
jgi:isopenicillin N synthase-like dioxygenase